MFAAAYMYGPLNTNGCPAGSVPLITAAACEIAAQANGVTYGGIGSYSSYPAGCYRWADDGAVYFNPHATGNPESKSQPLCSAGTAAPTGLSTAPPTEPPTALPTQPPTSTRSPAESPIGTVRLRGNAMQHLRMALGWLRLHVQQLVIRGHGSAGGTGRSQQSHPLSRLAVYGSARPDAITMQAPCFVDARPCSAGRSADARRFVRLHSRCDRRQRVPRRICSPYQRRGVPERCNRVGRAVRWKSLGCKSARRVLSGNLNGRCTKWRLR
jgi:hypothetical protein